MITATKMLEIIFLTLFIAFPPKKIHPKEIVRWVEIQHINLISFPTAQLYHLGKYCQELNCIIQCFSLNSERYILKKPDEKICVSHNESKNF